MRSVLPFIVAALVVAGVWFAKKHQTNAVVPRDFTSFAPSIKNDMTKDQCLLLLGAPDAWWRSSSGRNRGSFTDSDAERWVEFLSRVSGEATVDSFLAAVGDRRVSELTVEFDANWLPIGDDFEPVRCLQLGPQGVEFGREWFIGVHEGVEIRSWDVRINFELLPQFRDRANQLTQMASGFRFKPKFVGAWGNLFIFFDREWRVIETFLLPSATDGRTN
jgi:hypothetical protein